MHNFARVLLRTYTYESPVVSRSLGKGSGHARQTSTTRAETKKSRKTFLLKLSFIQVVANCISSIGRANKIGSFVLCPFVTRLLVANSFNSVSSDSTAAPMLEECR